ncbi:unnamed protein product [marine sediment metagenome]|uniref:Uncharacterized protein n=1 Tax=marine sediment metagenome TaxID=412755 RepID=X1FXZ9_9ZZZZ
MPNPIADFPWEKTWVNATNPVHVGKCVLHTVVLNACTVLGVVTVYDALDATDATLIVASYSLLGASISFQGITFTYDCEMKNGIYVDFTGNFAGNLTVTYK